MDPTARAWVPSAYRGSEHPLPMSNLNGWPSFPPSPSKQRQPSQPRAVAMPVVSPVAITLDQQYLTELEALLHPLSELRNAGYVLDNLTPEEVEAKARCQVCGKFVKRYNKKIENRRPGPSGPQGWKSGVLKPAKSVQEGSKAPDVSASASNSTNASSTTLKSTHSQLSAKRIFPNGHPDADEPPPKPICKFHSGVINRKARVSSQCLLHQLHWRN